MFRHLSFAILLLHSSFAWCEGAATLDADELAALSAAVEQTHKLNPSGWLLIEAQTAAFPCDPGEARVVILDGCSGLARPGQDPADMLVVVKEAIPALDDEVIRDFLAKGAASVAIGAPLAHSIRQVIWTPAEPAGFPADLGKPEAAMNLSRVGFDASRSRALLYIGSISYTASEHSFGEYVYLTKTNGSWTVQGTMQSWKMGQ